MRKPDKERLVSLLAAGSYEPPGEVERRATELLDEGRVVDGLAGVGETSRRFLAFVARTGGEVGPGAAAWWLNRQQVEDPDAFVEGLASKGLLFYVPAGGLARASDDPAAGALGLGVAGKLWVPEAVGLPAAAQHPPEPLSIASDPAQVIRAEPW
ncbi:MAG: hypothetical protein FJX74_06260, partial [Armatimonadetes bacterium]|nr:hypothetical protein [Armatimonadota bacterium]